VSPLENDEYKIFSSRERIRSYCKVITIFGAKPYFETLPFLAGKGFDEAGIVRYAKVAQVAVGFKEWKGIAAWDGFGALITSRESAIFWEFCLCPLFFRNRAQLESDACHFRRRTAPSRNLVSLDDASLLAIVKRELPRFPTFPI
jgi:hypothetical protein